MSSHVVPNVSGTTLLSSSETPNISKFYNVRMNYLVSQLANIKLSNNNFANDPSKLTLSPEQCRSLKLSQFLQFKIMTIGLNVLNKKIIPLEDEQHVYNLFKTLSESMVEKTKYKYRNTTIDAINKEITKYPETKEFLNNLKVLRELSENKNFLEEKLDTDSVPLSKGAQKLLKNIQNFFNDFMKNKIEAEQKEKAESLEELPPLMGENGQLLNDPFLDLYESEIKEKEDKVNSEESEEKENVEGSEDENEMEEHFIASCSPSSSRSPKVKVKNELYKLRAIPSPHLINSESPDSTVMRVAQLQQVHALNAFKDTLKMMILARSYLTERHEKLNSFVKSSFSNVFFPYFFLLGHSALEQGLNVLQIKKHNYESDVQLGANRHSLNKILIDLNMTKKIDNNFWLTQNNIGTFNWRYPYSQILSCNHTGSKVPDTLSNIVDLETSTTSKKVIELYRNMSNQWLVSWLAFHAEIKTTQQAYDNMQEIEMIKDSFEVNIERSKLSLALLKLPSELIESFDRTYNDLNLLQEFLVKTIIPNTSKKFGRNSIEIACMNDLKHHIMQLRDLCSTMKHIAHFPYLYCYLHLATLSGQFAAENTGKALADQKGISHLKSRVKGLHDLSKFKSLWVGLSDGEIKLLNDLNLKKYSEYPYRYFAKLSTHAKKSSLMLDKGYLYNIRNKSLPSIEYYTKTGKSVVEICKLVQRLAIKLDPKKELEFLEQREREAKISH